MKYLIVDDNERFREYLREVITERGDSCAELSDGKELNKVYEFYEPDVVLLDIRMKEVGGFEAARSLVNNCPDACIIIISNYSDKYFRAKALKVGAKAFLAKDNISALWQIVADNQSVISKQNI